MTTPPSMNPLGKDSYNHPESTERDEKKGSLTGRAVQQGRYIVALPLDLASKIAYIGSNKFVAGSAAFSLSAVGLIASGSVEMLMKIIRVIAQQGGIEKTAEGMQEGAQKTVDSSTDQAQIFTQHVPVAGAFLSMGVSQSANAIKGYLNTLFGVCGSILPTITTATTSTAGYLEGIFGNVRKLSLEGVTSPHTAWQSVYNLATRIETLSYVIKGNEEEALDVDETGRTGIEKRVLLSDKELVDLSSSEKKHPFLKGSSSDRLNMLYKVFSSDIVTYSNKEGKKSTARISVSWSDAKRVLDIIEKIENKGSLSDTDSRLVQKIVWIHKNIPENRIGFTRGEYLALKFDHRRRLIQLVQSFPKKMDKEELELLNKASKLASQDEWDKGLTSEEQRKVECITICRFNAIAEKSTPLSHKDLIVFSSSESADPFLKCSLLERLNMLYKVFSSDTVRYPTQEGIQRTARFELSWSDAKHILDIIERMEKKLPLSQSHLRLIQRLVWIHKHIPKQLGGFTWDNYFALDFHQKIRLIQLVKKYASPMAQEEHRLLNKAGSIASQSEWDAILSPEEQRKIECIAICRFNKISIEKQLKLFEVSKEQVELLPFESRQVVFSLVKEIIQKSGSDEGKTALKNLIESSDKGEEELLKDREGVRKFVLFMQKHLPPEGKLIIQGAMKQTLQVYEFSEEEIQRQIQEINEALKTSMKEEDIKTLTSYRLALEEALKTQHSLVQALAAPQKKPKTAGTKESVLETLKKQSSPLDTFVQMEEIQRRIGIQIVSQGAFYRTGYILGGISEETIKLGFTGSAQLMNFAGWMSNPLFIRCLTNLGAQGIILASSFRESVSFIANFSHDQLGLNLEAVEKAGIDLTKKTLEAAPYIKNTALSAADTISSWLRSGAKALDKEALIGLINRTKENQDEFAKGLQAACHQHNGFTQFCTPEFQEAMTKGDLTSVFGRIQSAIRPETSSDYSKIYENALAAIAKNTVEQGKTIGQKVTESIMSIFGSGSVTAKDAQNLFAQAPELKTHFSSLVEATKNYTEIQARLKGTIETGRLLGESSKFFKDIAERFPNAATSMHSAADMIGGVSDALKTQSFLLDAASATASAQLSVAKLAPTVREKLQSKGKEFTNETWTQSILKYSFGYVLPTITTVLAGASGGYVFVPLLMKKALAPAFKAGGYWLADHQQQMWYTLAEKTKKTGETVGKKTNESITSLGAYIQSKYNLGRFIDPERKKNFLALSQDEKNKPHQQHIFDIVVQSQAFQEPLEEAIMAIFDNHESTVERIRESSNSAYKKIFNRFLDDVQHACLKEQSLESLSQILDERWKSFCSGTDSLVKKPIKEETEQVWKELSRELITAYSESAKGELGKLWLEFQKGEITKENQEKLLDGLLFAFDRLKPSEVLAISPIMFKSLDKHIQDRIRYAVRKFSSEGLKKSEENEISMVVERFNDLEPEQRASIDVMSVREFHELPLHEQKELLFAIIHSQAYKKYLKKRLNLQHTPALKEIFGIYSSSLQIKDNTLVPSESVRFHPTNQELKNLLQLLPQLSEEEISTMTPGKLRRQGDIKMEHAYAIVEKYAGKYLPKNLNKKLPKRHGSLVDLKIRSRYSEIVASIFRQLESHQQAELLLFTQEEFESMPQGELEKYARAIILDQKESSETDIKALKSLVEGKKPIPSELFMKIFNTLLDDEQRARIRGEVQGLQGQEIGSIEDLMGDMHAIEQKITKLSKQIQRKTKRLEALEEQRQEVRQLRTLDSTTREDTILIKQKALATTISTLKDELHQKTEEYTNMKVLLDSIGVETSEIDAVQEAVQKEEEHEISKTLLDVLSLPLVQEENRYKSRISIAKNSLTIKKIRDDIEAFVNCQRDAVQAEITGIRKEISTIKKDLHSLPPEEQIIKQAHIAYLHKKISMFRCYTKAVEDFLKRMEHETESRKKVLGASSVQKSRPWYKSLFPAIGNRLKSIALSLRSGAYRLGKLFLSFFRRSPPKA